tara:strand:+ start:619 stop:1248 length:630 start_codon:yes stop_codon:yes gene_type:complete
VIIFGLSASRKEAKKIHLFLNSQNGFCVNYESDLQNISWNNSENIVINRVHALEKKIYNNTSKMKDNFRVVGDTGFYLLPYLELLINNFPYIKFIYTKKSKQNTYDDIISDIKTDYSTLYRLLFFKKKYKNHWIEHNGKKWEQDYILDKCYPKFKIDKLEDSIYKYMDYYDRNTKRISRKYPKNLKIFYSDEISSNYGKNKVLSFIGVN